MEFSFFITDQGEAYMQGNADLVPVMPLVGENAVSFVEPIGSGVVQTTTVSLNGSAVHSRHTIIGNEFTSSQWHGACKVFGSEE